MSVATRRARNNSSRPDKTEEEVGELDRMEEFKIWFKRDKDHFKKWYDEARECYDFIANRQWDEEDIATMKRQNRPVITFNRTATVIDSICGLEVQNRQEVRFVPRQVGASAVNELLTDAGKWARDECGAEDEESDAFVDLIVTGIGCTESRIDYDEVPDGKFILERVDPLEMVPDSHSKARNFTDARHHFRVRQIDTGAAEEMAADQFPDCDLEDMDAVWAREPEENIGDPHNRTEAQFYRNDQSPQNAKHEGLITLVEVQWWELKDEYRVADPLSGKIVTLQREDFDKLSARAKQLGIKLIAAPMKTKRYYRALLGKKILKMWDGPEEGGFTWKYMTGKRDRNKRHWYGLVRTMLDPQRWANKWLAQVMHIINANAKGGLLAEEDAFANPQQAMEEYSSTDSITFVTQGALSGPNPKIKEKGIAQYPQGIEGLMQFAITSIRDVSGVNIELLGMADRDQPGMIEHSRKQAALSILAGVFDSLRQYRKEQGKLLLYFITNFLADGRLIRIGGADQAQYVPLVHIPDLVQYDVIVDDAPTSANSKEQAWFALTQMMPVLSRMALSPEAIFAILKYSPLPTSLLTDVQKAMQAAASKPQPPDPKVIEAQSKQQVAQIQAQTEQVRAQAEAQSEQARALGQVAQARAEAQRSAQEIGQQNAEAFATTAAGIKSLADAQVAMQGPHFDALQMLMDALNKEFDRRAQTQQQGAQNAMQAAQQSQDMQHAQEAHAMDMASQQQQMQQGQQDMAAQQQDMQQQAAQPPGPPQQ